MKIGAKIVMMHWNKESWRDKFSTNEYTPAGGWFSLIEVKGEDV